MQYCIFNDRYAVRILMMVYERGTIISSDFKEISSSYDSIVRSAQELVDQGLLEKTKGRHCVRWSPTDRGQMLGIFFSFCNYFSLGQLGQEELTAILAKLYDRRNETRYKS